MSMRMESWGIFYIVEGWGKNNLYEMKKGTIYFLTVPFDKQSFALQHITYYDTLLYDYIGNNNGSIFFILLFKFSLLSR